MPEANEAEKLRGVGDIVVGSEGAKDREARGAGGGRRAWSGRANEDGGEEDLEELLEFEEEVALLVRPVRPEHGLVGGVRGGQDRRGCGDEGVHEHLRGIGRLERREDEMRILRPDVL